jgi:dihydroflavonol-4-reductase
MRTLVTGAAGLIGHHVVRLLRERGDEVRALVLPSVDRRNLRGLDLEVAIGDVTDPIAVERAMRGIEVVYHLAAVYALWTADHGAQMRRVNVEGTRIVLEEARRAGVRRVVHTSSIARFGGQGRGARATERSPFALGATGSAYAQSKADAHELAVAAAQVGQDVVIVAPCAPIGPGDVGPTPTGRLLIECMSLPVITVTRSVSNVIDVRDVAMGHLLAADHGLRGHTYLLGHRDLHLWELALLAQRVTGSRAPIVEVPFAIAGAAARVAAGLAERNTGRAPVITPDAIAIAELGLAADCTKAVCALGLPQSPIERALEDALAWFERERMTPGRRSARARSSRPTETSASDAVVPETASRARSRLLSIATS